MLAHLALALKRRKYSSRGGRVEIESGNGQQDDRHHCRAVAQIGTNVGTEAATVTIRILTKIICIVI